MTVPSPDTVRTAWADRLGALVGKPPPEAVDAAGPELAGLRVFADALRGDEPAAFTVALTSLLDVEEADLRAFAGPLPPGAELTVVAGPDTVTDPAAPPPGLERADLCLLTLRAGAPFSTRDREFADRALREGRIPYAAALVSGIELIEPDERAEVLGRIRARVARSWPELPVLCPSDGKPVSAFVADCLADEDLPVRRLYRSAWRIRDLLATLLAGLAGPDAAARDAATERRLEAAGARAGALAALAERRDAAIAEVRERLREAWNREIEQLKRELSVSRDPEKWVQSQAERRLNEAAERVYSAQREWLEHKRLPADAALAGVPLPAIAAEPLDLDGPLRPDPERAVGPDDATMLFSLTGGALMIRSFTRKISDRSQRAVFRHAANGMTVVFGLMTAYSFVKDRWVSTRNAVTEVSRVADRGATLLVTEITEYADERYEQLFAELEPGGPPSADEGLLGFVDRLRAFDREFEETLLVAPDPAPRGTETEGAA